MDLASPNPPGDVQPATADTLSISDLAREFDVTTRTIRFYEDLGLIQPARSGLTRIYSPRDRVRLKLILRGKRIGFSLSEIGEIMDMYDSEPGEVGQLEYMLDRLATRRAQLLRQQNDIDLTLKELTDIETQCRTQLAAMQGHSPTADKEQS